MSGVAAIAALLRANAGVTAVVPATSIFAGPAPQGASLPVVSIFQVSGSERQTVSMGEPKRLRAERVQVTVDASSYPAKKQILELVRRACVVTGVTVNGIEVLSVLPGPEGPDDDNVAAEIFSQPRDFFVQWRFAAA